MNTLEFERQLLTTVDQIRDIFQEQNIPNIQLNIEVSGRVHDGDLEISFSCGNLYSTNRTEGGSLSFVIEEFLRRKKWNTRHAPLCLPRAPAEAANKEEADEIAF